MFSLQIRSHANYWANCILESSLYRSTSKYHLNNLHLTSTICAILNSSFKSISFPLENKSNQDSKYFLLPIICDAEIAKTKAQLIRLFDAHF